MRPGKPFFSRSPWPGGWERLTNRFMSTVLWNQEQAYLGSSKLETVLFCCYHDLPPSRGVIWETTTTVHLVLNRILSL